MEEQKVQQVRDEKVRYYSVGRGEPLLFMHGFGIAPQHGYDLIQNLSGEFEVIAPSLYGMNYLENPPTSIGEQAELTQEFCSALGLDSYCAAGHSLGGAVGMELAKGSPGLTMLVMANPVMENDNNLLTFSIKAVYKTAKELFGLTGGLQGPKMVFRTSPGFMLNRMANQKKSNETIRSICDYAPTGKVAQPSLLLYGSDDEYFKLDEDRIKESFSDLKIIKKPGYNHDWIALYPDEAAEDIKGFLTRPDARP